MNRWIRIGIFYPELDAIRFCGEFELALRGHDESENSDNPGVFKGLINYTAALDTLLKDHLENSTVFKGTSKTIQNDILDAMLGVCQKYITKEISSVGFVSLQADGTTDVSCKTQLDIILRYEIEDQIFERFWGFSEVHDRTAVGLSTVIFEQLSKVRLDKEPNKLICQTYDGASVMRGENRGVQHLIKERYPLANYVHCYAHQGNLIMQNATSSVSQSRIFSSDLQGIGQFISRSPKRMDCLNEIVKKKSLLVPQRDGTFRNVLSVPFMKTERPCWNVLSILGTLKSK